MARILEERILESSTTTGTGDFTLAGAVMGFRRFNEKCAIGDTFSYLIEAIDSTGLPTGAYEYGTGTYSAANVLTRTTVLGSSNADAAVNFAAGAKNVAIVLSKQELALRYLSLTGGAMAGALALAAGSTAPTPPQFDNDTELAPTAFVMRALGNRQLSAGATYAVNTAIGVAAMGGWGKVTAAAVTLTLPDPTTVGLGSTYAFVPGSFAATITAAGAGIVGGNYALKANEGVMFVANGAGGWVLLNAATPVDGVAAKAWVNFNGTGTVAIRSSYNVTSITDHGVGDYTVNFTSALADANYATVGTAQEDSLGAAIRTYMSYARTPTTTTCPITTGCQNTSNANVPVDSPRVCVSFFR